MLRSMIDDGLVEKTAELRFITNGTQHDSEILTLLSEFPRVDVGVSIDAVGPLHVYTRGSNVSWDECRRSWQILRSLPNISRFRICNTLYAYNVFDIKNLRRWVASEFGDETPMADAILHKPEYLRADILSESLLVAARQMLDADDPLEQFLRRCIDTPLWTPDAVHKARARFMEFTARLDAIRGESLAALVPQLSSMF